MSFSPITSVTTGLLQSLTTPVGIAWNEYWVGLSVVSVSLLMCRFPCPQRKTIWAVNTKFGRDIVYRKPSVCTSPKVKRSNQRMGNVRSMGLHGDMTAHFLVINITSRKLATLVFGLNASDGPSQACGLARAAQSHVLKRTDNQTVLLL